MRPWKLYKISYVFSNVHYSKINLFTSISIKFLKSSSSLLFNKLRKYLLWCLEHVYTKFWRFKVGQIWKLTCHFHWLMWEPLSFKLRQNGLPSTHHSMDDGNDIFCRQHIFDGAIFWGIFRKNEICIFFGSHIWTHLKQKWFDLGTSR